MQTSPTMAGCQVYNDDTVRSLLRRIGDEHHASAAAEQIKAHVIKVSSWQCNVLGKTGSLDNFICIQISTTALVH